MESLEEADLLIEQTTELIQSLERIIQKAPEMPTVPAALEGAMTPLSIYCSLQIHLATLKSRRMKMLSEACSHTRTVYEINKAVEAEDFELAAILKNRLDAR